MVGDGVALVATPWLVLKVTNSPFDLGVALALQTTIGAIVLVVSSPLADRHNATKVAVAANIASASSLSLIPIAYVMHRLSLTLIVVAMCLAQGTQAPAVGARQRLIRSKAVAAGVTFRHANSVYWILQQIGLLVGAPVGGILIYVLGAPNALGIDAVSFLVAAAIVAVVAGSEDREDVQARGDLRQRGTYWSDLVAGVKVAVATPALRLIGGCALILNGFDGALLPVLVPVAIRHQHQSVQSLGVLGGVYAVGMVMGATVGGAVGTRISVRRLAAICVSFVGIGYFLLGTDPHFMAMGIGLIGVASGPLMPLLLTTIQASVPTEILSRVTGSMFAVLVSSAPIGMLFVGIAARSWSVAYVCDVGSGVFLIAAATIAVRGGILETFPQQTITSLE
jgi:MFS family permease